MGKTRYNTLKFSVHASVRSIIKRLITMTLQETRHQVVNSNKQEAK